MISEITSGKLGLDDFEVPAQCTLRRVRHGEKRFSEAVCGIAMYYIQKKGPGEGRTCVVPSSVQSVRSLLLSLEEGSVGTAGVTAAAFRRKTSIWINPDKIRRVFRDLNLAEGNCCNTVFEGATL